jgi:hypothetical protein
MTLIIADRIKESSTTTGSGAMTLAGAYTGFRAFSAVCTSPSDTCYYTIQAVDGSGVPTGDWEVGLGTYSAANTLTRSTVLSSSNAGAAVSFAAGTKQVWLDLAAAQVASLNLAAASAFWTPPANPGFDPLFVGPTSAVTLSNSNKTATPASSSPYNHMLGTPARYTGKRYFEIVPSSTSFTAVGLAGGEGHQKQGDGGNFGAWYIGQIGWDSSGAVKAVNKFTSSPNVVTVATIQTWAATNNLCIAADLDALLIWFRTNGGNWNNSGANDPATGVGGIDLSWALSGASNRLLWPGMNAGNTGAQVMRLLAADFAQSVPSGYSAWGA